jgi:hypothetical protein
MGRTIVENTEVDLLNEQDRKIRQLQGKLIVRLIGAAYVIKESYDNKK